MNEDTRHRGRPPHARIQGTVAACLILIVLYDSLFFDHPAGWTAGAFALVSLGAVFWKLRPDIGKPVFRVLILVAFALSISLFNHPGSLALALTGITLLTLACSASLGWSSSGPLWLRRWSVFPILGWLGILFDADLYHKWRRTPAHRSRSFPKPNFSALILPLILLAVFGALFKAANPLIDLWTGSAWQAIHDWAANFWERIGFARVMIWLSVGAWSWALLRPRSWGRRFTLFLRGKTARPSWRRSRIRSLNDRTAVLRSLWVCVLLFSVQTILDAFYLWGGMQLPEGMTYAEYAHRGAYPLVVTALLTAIFVLLVFRPGSDLSASPVARRLVTVWLGQNILLTVSAAWRLNLYVEVYHLTRLRVAAAVWMVLVGTGLIWIVIRILAHRTNRWLVNANLITLLVLLAAVGLADVDRFIAGYNVDHCREVTGQGSDLDLEYLDSLGFSSIPALERLGDTLGMKGTGLQAADLSRSLRNRLHQRLEDPRAWTLRLHRLSRRHPRYPIDMTPLSGDTLGARRSEGFAR